MRLIRIVIVFHPTTKKNAIELLQSYGFANILNGWTGKIKIYPKNIEQIINLPRRSLSVRIPSEQKGVWLEVLSNEDKINNIIIKDLMEKK